MKTADIKIGEEYALGKPGDRRPERFAARCRVEALHVELPKARSWSKVRMNGIRVVVLDKNTGEIRRGYKPPLYSPRDGMVEDRRIVRAQEILMVWSERGKRVKDFERHEAEAQEMKHVRALAQAALYDRFERLGVRFGFRREGHSIDLSIEDAGRVLDLIGNLQAARAGTSTTARARAGDGFCSCARETGMHPRLGLCSLKGVD